MFSNHRLLSFIMVKSNTNTPNVFTSGCVLGVFNFLNPIGEFLRSHAEEYNHNNTRQKVLCDPKLYISTI